MKVPRRERHRIFQCLLLFLLFYIAREIYRFSGMSSLKTIQTTSSADSRTHNFFKSQKPKIHLLDPETVKDANISKPRTHECLLLDADTYNMSRAIISPLTLKEHNSENLTNFYSTNSKMLNAIKSITELLSFYPLPTLSPGSTCIIVGSSGVLLQHSGLGKTIDNYDYVIRMNFAPTSKFEDFVGSKTSMHFAYLRSCLIALKNYRQINNSHILYGGSRLDEYVALRRNILSRENSTFKAMLKNNRFTLLSEYSKEWIARNLWKRGKTRPTTGIIALLFASHWCPTIPDFAGFGMEFKSSEVPYHYFDNVTYFKNVHSATNENYGIIKLQRYGYLGKDLTQSVSLRNRDPPAPSRTKENAAKLKAKREKKL